MATLVELCFKIISKKISIYNIINDDYIIIKDTVFYIDNNYKNNILNGIILIQFHIRRFLKYKITIIRHNCITKYKIRNIKFKLKCNNFNYNDYLNNNFIKNIKIIDYNIVRIDLDRFKIRHCHDRYIIVNLNTGQITWFNVPLSNCKKSYQEEILMEDELKLIL